MAITEWKMGDRVIHAGRPEWGLGEVRTAESVVQDGRRSQRLTIRFDRAGVKVLSTAFADLRPAGELASIVQEPPESEEPPADQAELLRKLAELPEPAVDPFKSRKARLESTLGLYRFSGTGASLLDWAASQTGLRDPLGRFSRHELEQQFHRFRINLDAQLRKLAYELRKEDPAGLAAAAASAGPEAKQALRRADAGR
jgi:hypothetical protein